MDPLAPEFDYDSPPYEELPGQNPMVSDPPLPHSTVSPSLCLTPQDPPFDPGCGPGGTSTRDPLEELRSLDMSSPKFHDQLSDILRGEEYKRRVSDLQGGDLTWLVDYLDQVRLPVSLTRSPLKPP